MFDSYDQSWELVSLATDLESATLYGVQLIGLKKKEVNNAIQNFSLSKYTHENLTTDETPSGFIMSFESCGLDFWFEGDTLIEIQWSPIVE